MGWLNDIFEALKNNIEIVLPTTAGAVFLIIGMSLLKTWRARAVAKIHASGKNDIIEKFEERIKSVIEMSDGLQKAYLEQGLSIQAFIEATMNAPHNKEARKYYDQRVEQLKDEAKSLAQKKLSLAEQKLSVIEDNIPRAKKTIKKIKRKLAVSNVQKDLE
jgi:hypothetical protein